MFRLSNKSLNHIFWVFRRSSSSAQFNNKLPDDRVEVKFVHLPSSWTRQNTEFPNIFTKMRRFVKTTIFYLLQDDYTFAPLKNPSSTIIIHNQPVFLQICYPHHVYKAHAGEARPFEDVLAELDKKQMESDAAGCRSYSVKISLIVW